MTDPFDKLRARASAIITEGVQDRTPDERVQRMLEESRLLHTELELQQEELREAQGRLRAASERYRQLFEAAPVAFVLISPSQQLEDANASARSLLGLEDHWRRRASMPFHRFVAVSALPEWSLMLRTDATQGRIQFVGRAGMFHADVRIARWSGVEGGWLVALADVTELSEAQSRRLEAERRYAQIATTMSEGLVVVDGSTGLIEQHNEAFARMLGRAGESLVGQMHDQHLEASSRGVQTLLLERAYRAPSAAPVRLRYRCVDETIRIVDVMLGSSRDRGPARHHMIARDVTEVVNAEREREAVEKRLAQTQKLEALGLLAAGIAHDMNNVLTAVLAATETAPTLEAMADLHAVALHGRELTGRLLAVSRRQPARNELFDLLAVAREAVSLARRTFPRAIDLDVELPSGAWAMRGDAGQWHQALLNALINARDAMPASGGAIAVLARVQAASRVLIVRDEGSGMDAETVRRAFEPFFTTKPEGTGLGLAHAHAVARAHDGAASVSSVLGQGTELRFELPETVFVRERVQSGGEAPRPHRAGNPRALVVDDEPMVLRATARLLHEQGWSTTTVTTGHDALTELEAHEFDLILTDRSMPGMSGEELCRRVHALKPLLAIVVMTGLIDESEERALRDDGVRAIVTKPFRSTELADALASAASAEAPVSAPS